MSVIRPTRSVAVHLLLAVVLALSQLVGAVHAAGHAPGHGQTHDHGTGVKLKVCDQCLAAATVEPAPGAAALPPIATAAATVSPEFTGREHIAARPPAFRSRAPPVSA